MPLSSLSSVCMSKKCRLTNTTISDCRPPEFVGNARERKPDEMERQPNSGEDAIQLQMNEQSACSSTNILCAAGQGCDKSQKLYLLTSLNPAEIRALGLRALPKIALLTLRVLQNLEAFILTGWRERQ